MHKTQDKSQIPNPKSQIPKLQTKKFWLLVIGSLVIILNFVLGFWDLTFAQDKIVAVVNNDIITQKDLNDFINFMRMQLSQEFSPEELEGKIQSMRFDLIDKLIEDRLILQEAKRILQEAKKNKDRLVISQLDVDQGRIKARINEMKMRYGSEATFQAAIIQQGLTQADIESRIGEQLLMRNIIELKIRYKIVIKPAEATDFYQKNLEKFKTAEVREVTLITADSEKSADEIFSELKQAQDMDAVAGKYALKTERLNFRQNKELRKDVEEAIFKLGIGQISTPIKANDKFYIFRLDNIVMSRQEGLAEVQDRIYAFLMDAKMQQGLVDWLDELREKSYIKIIK